MNTNIPNSKDWLEYTDVFLDPILLIITFFFGYLISNWQVKRKESKDLEEQYDYFVLYLSKQRDAITKQIKEIEGSIKVLENTKPFKTTQTKLIIQPFELLNSMDKARVTKSFQYKGKAPGDALNLFVFINLCMENFSSFRESNLRFSQRQNEILNKWNLLIEDFHQSKMHSINLPKEDLLKIPELLKLNDYYNAFCAVEPSDNTPANAMAVCIGPLKDYFNQLLKSDHTNKYALEYIPKLEKIGITYMQSENYIEQHLEYLKTIIGLTKQQMEKSNINKYIL
jgi:hypothetical protein